MDEKLIFIETSCYNGSIPYKHGVNKKIGYLNSMFNKLMPGGNHKITKIYIGYRDNDGKVNVEKEITYKELMELFE